ncbi:MAG TPA: hypothetical protein VFQ41_07120 [Candidatus Angelobacter sp.]|nr:hypothetical protein [Candidatus Angelobacter sp.]
MAERVHKSSDIPNFDTYPSAPSDEVIDYKSVERPSMDRPSNATPSLNRSSLEQRAAELGAAAGRIAVIMRQTKENVENLGQHAVYDRVSRLAATAKIRTENLRRRAGARVQELTHAAQDKAAELGNQAKEKTVELGRQARNNYYQARLKAKQTVREYPVETALAAGAAGLLVGVALRIGRARRAH